MVSTETFNLLSAALVSENDLKCFVAGSTVQISTVSGRSTSSI